MCFLMGLGGVIYGLAIRFDQQGRFRSNFDRYFDKSWTFHYRNRAFGLIPYGMTFILWGIAFTVAGLGDPWQGITTVLIILGFLVGIAGIILTYRPPDWLKPEWLREEEWRRREQR